MAGILAVGPRLRLSAAYQPARFSALVNLGLGLKLIGSLQLIQPGTQAERSNARSSGRSVLGSGCASFLLSLTKPPRQ